MGTYPNFHATNGSVLFNYGLIDLPKEKTKKILDRLGFKKRCWAVSMLEHRCSLIYKSLNGQKDRYKRGAKPSEAPNKMDCSSLTQFAYKIGLGVEIPRLAIEQFEAGTPIDLASALPGDLVFKKGKRSRFESNPDAGIGHVGIIINPAAGLMVLHTTSKNGVSIVPLKKFCENQNQFRGIRRIVPGMAEWFVLDIPDSLKEVITHTNSVKWRVLTSLE